MPILLLVLVLKFFFKVVVSRVGWIDTGRPSQSLELSRK